MGVYMSKKLITVLMVSLVSSAYAEDEGCPEGMNCTQLAAGAALTVASGAYSNTIDHSSHNSVFKPAEPVAVDDLFDLKPSKGDVIEINSHLSLADSKARYVKLMEADIQHLKEAKARYVSDHRIADSLDLQSRIDEEEAKLRKLKSGQTQISPIKESTSIVIGKPGEKSIFDVQAEIKKKKGTVIGARHYVLKSQKQQDIEGKRHSLKTMGSALGAVTGMAVFGAGLIPDGELNDSENVEMSPVQVAE